MSLKLEILARPEPLKALESEWRSLWERDPNATPFQGPDWLIPWMDRLWGGGRLATLAFRHGDELVGVAPFFLWGFGSRPEIVRLSWLGAGITDYLGITAAPDFAIPVAREIVGRLSAIPDWRLCDLQELRPDSPLLHVEAPHELDIREVPCSKCPVLRLPKLLDALLAGLSPHFRRNLRTAENRLRRQGAVEFVRVEECDVDEWMRALFRLHTLRWRERHDRGMLAGARLEEFHLEVARRFARFGMLRLYGIRLNGRPIAVQYNLAAKGASYYYLSGFDPAMAHASPGALLLRHAIADAITEGMHTVDFLRKSEAYKYDWGARDQVSRRLLVSRAGVAIGEVA